jgi:hypothetical protein
VGKHATDLPKPPGWAWGFVAACVAIPVVTLGGAIPGALGAGSAALCHGLARDPKRPEQHRVLLCGLVTVVAWGAFGALLAAVA